MTSSALLHLSNFFFSSHVVCSGPSNNTTRPRSDDFFVLVPLLLPLHVSLCVFSLMSCYACLAHRKVSLDSTIVHYSSAATASQCHAKYCITYCSAAPQCLPLTLSTASLSFRHLPQHSQSDTQQTAKHAPHFFSSGVSGSSLTGCLRPPPPLPSLLPLPLPSDNPISEIPNTAELIPSVLFSL